MKHILFLFVAALAVISCQKKGAELPSYSKAEIPGTYTNQNGETVTSKDYEGKIVVADFIFTHCPSICPPMARQMTRIQNEYKDKDDLRLLSFSIDPKRDTVGRLKWYSDKIGANPDMWHFVTAPKNVITETSEKLMVFQEADESAPGGFNHQSRFILIDRDGTVRGYYDGVNPEDVDKLINDIKKLY